MFILIKVAVANRAGDLPKNNKLCAFGKDESGLSCVCWPFLISFQTQHPSKIVTQQLEPKIVLLMIYIQNDKAVQFSSEYCLFA
jgi:hypothetical protein